MEKLTQALSEAEKAQVYRYEVVHENIQKLTNNYLRTHELPTVKTPTNLLDYKVKKSNIAQYEQLTGGQMK